MRKGLAGRSNNQSGTIVINETRTLNGVTVVVDGSFNASASIMGQISGGQVSSFETVFDVFHDMDVSLTVDDSLVSGEVDMSAELFRQRYAPINVGGAITVTPVATVKTIGSIRANGTKKSA